MSSSINTPLGADATTQQQQHQQQQDPNSADYKMHQRTRSQQMVEDHHEHIVDEDPLLISQSLTYVTDEGDVLHSFQSSPFSFGTLLCSCVWMMVGEGKA